MTDCFYSNDDINANVDGVAVDVETIKDSVKQLEKDNIKLKYEIEKLSIDLKYLVDVIKILNGVDKKNITACVV